MDDFNTKLNELREMYRNLEKDYKTLSKKINGWSKDRELKKAQKEAEYARTHSLCQLSDKELIAIRKFRDKHYNECAIPFHNKGKGNTYIYTLTGTGIGTIIEITCPICGATLDVTDLNNW